MCVCVLLVLFPSLSHMTLKRRRVKQTIVVFFFFFLNRTTVFSSIWEAGKAGEKEKEEAKSKQEVENATLAAAPESNAKREWMGGADNRSAYARRIVVSDVSIQKSYILTCHLSSKSENLPLCARQSACNVTPCKKKKREKQKGSYLG